MAARKSRKKEKTDEEKAAEEKAAERFIEGLLLRGEAARPDEHGNLPPGATHEIVEEPGGGKPPKVRRRRFSMR